MSDKFKGFNVEEPSSTRVDIPVPVGADPNRFGSIKQYRPNLIDRISNLTPDTGVSGVLKGLYQGVDDTFFGLLPSGNYGSSTAETKLGKQMSFIAEPIAGAKAIKYAVSGGTHISRLLANSIEPLYYNNKWGSLKRVLTNPKVLKEAVIDDIPQYVLHKGTEDRLFAWRKKLGLGKPNERYNHAINPGLWNKKEMAKKEIDYWWKHRPYEKPLNNRTHKDLDAIRNFETNKRWIKDYEHNNPIDKLWNKFDSHVEDGKTYYHYKNPDDYFKAKGVGFHDRHGLFGGYSKKRTMKGDYNIGGVEKEHYYDNWDFAYNRPLKDIISGKGGGYEKQGIGTLFQRSLAEALLQPLEFKGTAKKTYRKLRSMSSSYAPYGVDTR